MNSLKPARLNRWGGLDPINNGRDNLLPEVRSLPFYILSLGLLSTVQVTDEYNPLTYISHAASGTISISGRTNAQLFDEQGICPIDMRLISYYTVYRVPRDNSCNKASRCRKYHLGRNLHVWCTWWIYIFWCDPCSIYSLGYRCTRSSVLINV